MIFFSISGRLLLPKLTIVLNSKRQQPFFTSLKRKRDTNNNTLIMSKTGILQQNVIAVAGFLIQDIVFKPKFEKLTKIIMIIKLSHNKANNTIENYLKI